MICKEMVMNESEGRGSTAQRRDDSRWEKEELLLGLMGGVMVWMAQGTWN